MIYMVVPMKRRLGLAATLFILVLVTACGAPRTDGIPEEAGISDKYPAYLSLVDGLHVTGTPIEVDIDEYRLFVTGNVEKTLSLTFDEVKAFEPSRIHMELNCPGFFIDEGFWTGVYVRDLLAEAKVDPEATVVRLISIDGSYSKYLAIDDILESDIMVAYEFQDEEFPVYHGFPLRIAAEGQPGSIWVKWLGKIEVK